MQSGGDAEQVAAVYAERDLFAVLGASALIGRTFGSKDPDNVIVASHEWWKGRLGGDSSAIGLPVTLDGQMYTLIDQTRAQVIARAPRSCWDGSLDCLRQRRKPALGTDGKSFPRVRDS
jgi:hypothetical protein